MQVENAIKLKPLNNSEVMALLNSPKFNLLKPLKCLDCGHSGDFSRRIFRIIGVKKQERTDDHIQNIITWNMQQKGIASVWFKSNRDKFYADTACCPNCQSTHIQFDVEMTDDVLKQLAKFTGHPEEEIRAGIATITAQIMSAEQGKHKGKHK